MYIQAIIILKILLFGHAAETIHILYINITPGIMVLSLLLCSLNAKNEAKHRDYDIGNTATFMGVATKKRPLAHGRRHGLLYHFCFTRYIGDPDTGSGVSI